MECRCRRSERQRQLADLGLPRCGRGETPAVWASNPKRPRHCTLLGRQPDVGAWVLGDWNERRGRAIVHKSGEHIGVKLTRATPDCWMTAGGRPLRPSNHPV